MKLEIRAIYEFDESIKSVCKYKKFEFYDEEWLDFILSCRNGGFDFKNFDIIEGGIANDKVFDMIELYFDGLIEKSEALKRLKFEKPNNQICFVNQEILQKSLKFDSFYEVQNGK